MQNNSGPKHPSNPLQPQGLGDSPIVWNTGLGSPTTVGGNLDVDATYIDANQGVRLSSESTNSVGSMYWAKDFDYSNDLYIKATIHSNHSGGEGGNGYTFFIGSEGSLTQSNDSTGSINVYFDELFYDDPYSNSLKVYVDGTKVGGEGSNFYLTQSLDDNQSRTVEILYEHKTADINYITVFLNGSYVCKLDCGSWIPGGNLIGVTASSNSDPSYVNNHYIKSFEVRSIVPWSAINKGVE